MDNNQNRAAANVALATQLAAWLRAAGVSHTEMSVDFADVVSGAERVAELLREMVTLTPSDPVQADEALDRMGKLYTWLFDEIRYHLGELEKFWPELEARLVALAPDES